jgi:hypothetical protein
MAPGHRPLGKNPHLEPVHGVATRLRDGSTSDGHAWDGVPAASSERETKHGAPAKTRSEAEGKNKG